MVTLIIDSCCDFVKTSDRTPRGGLNSNHGNAHTRTIWNPKSGDCSQKLCQTMNISYFVCHFTAKQLCAINYIVPFTDFIFKLLMKLF